MKKIMVNIHGRILFTKVKNRRYIKSMLTGIVLCLIFFGCGSGNSDVWKNETVEMKRFVKVKLADDFDEPMEMAVLPDGKVVVVERQGGVKLYVPGQHDIRLLTKLPVYTGQEDGLLGITIDPQFSANRYIYLYYSPKDSLPRQRVSRFVLDNDSLLLSTEKVIIEIPTQRQECCHSAGSIAFGPDGNLYIAVGDNTNPHNPGYYNSIDERKGREAWDAQRTAANTADLRGKILRIHVEENGTYTIPKGNLFAEGTAGTRPEIYVMGCRNPFRISLDAKRNWVFWGDVGQNTIDNPKRGPISYDEWNVATEPGFFGWPYFAGPNAAYADFDFETEKTGPFFDAANPVNESVNNTGLKKLPPAKKALIWYSYDESREFKYLGTGGKSPIAGPVYYSDQYKNLNDTTRHLPAHYDGKLFITEWMRDWINVVTLTNDGRVDSIEQFMPTAAFAHPIDLEIGSDGVLYVLEYGTNWFAKNKDAGLYRIEYNRGNRAPVAEINADQTTGGVPFTVQFSAEDSYDLDSSKLSFQWYFDKSEVQSTDLMPHYTFKQAGIYDVRLVVTDEEGKRAEKRIKIKAGNEEPRITMETSGNKSFYWPTTPVKYTIHVRDAEDGSLQEGGIPPDDVKITLAYNTMGTDVTMVAQAHEAGSGDPGFALMEKSDCKSCHALNDKSVGPSYAAIAARYKNDTATVEKLASKIISGGSGVWGEHVMSAHPQLTKQQSSQIVSYILSMNEHNRLSRPLSATGIILPEAAKEKGEYILSVTYRDREINGVSANEVKKNFYFRYPLLRAFNSNADSLVAKIDGSVVRFTKGGSWIMFSDVDLTGIRVTEFLVESTQIGGRLSLHLDQPDGQKVAEVSISKLNKPLKAGGDQKPGNWRLVTTKVAAVKGQHDLYIVYQNPPDAESDSWKTLFLKTIEFKK